MQAEIYILSHQDYFIQTEICVGLIFVVDGMVVVGWYHREKKMRLTSHTVAVDVDVR